MCKEIRFKSIKRVEAGVYLVEVGSFVMRLERIAGDWNLYLCGTLAAQYPSKREAMKVLRNIHERGMHAGSKISK